MNPEFWYERWTHREIGFNQSRPNPLLVKYFHSLNLKEQSRVFVPLTGKTVDVAWLLSEGFQVVGVELSETAVKELFEELSAEPEISKTENFRIYSADSIIIFVGDFFKLSSELIGQVNGIYDRAALVALPENMRKKYCNHLINITKAAPQLLIVFEYDQVQIPGPPFSISEQEIQQSYDERYNIQLFESKDVKGGLKGAVKASENIWLLK